MTKGQKNDKPKAGNRDKERVEGKEHPKSRAGSRVAEGLSWTKIEEIAKSNTGPVQKQQESSKADQKSQKKN